MVGSGRTDTGVHATGQVAAVDMPVRWTAEELHRALNAVLPRDIWVASVEAAAPDFHPRYDALARSYEYRVGTDPEARSPFHRGWCWPLVRPVDADLLDAAARLLPGEHSFKAFAKSGQPERGYRCRVREAAWEPWALGWRFRITADRYLHHMVRYLVGTQVEIARGRRTLEDMTRLLDGGGEVETSPPAPPQGLFLTAVEYPQSSAPPSRSRTITERRTAPLP